MQAIMAMRDPYLSKSLLDEFLIKNTETSYILKNILMEINKSQNLHKNESTKSTLDPIITLPVQKPVAIELSNKSDKHNQHDHNNNTKKKHAAVIKQSQAYKHKLKLYKNFLNDNKDCHKTRKQIQQELRDKVRLEEHGIGLSTGDIVDSNSDEFNELIKQRKLTAEQLALVKDIRRRGKNKLAAQTCRKRKLESIDSLKEDVENLTETLAVQEIQNDTIKFEILELFENFDGLYQDIMLGFSVANSENPILLNVQQTDADMKQLKESVRSITSAQQQASMEAQMHSVESFESHMEGSQDFYDELESEEDGEGSESVMSVGSEPSSSSSQTSINNDHVGYNNSNDSNNNVKHSFFIENLIGIHN